MSSADSKEDNKSVSNDSGTKAHVSVVITGHVDAGKSTTTGRLLYELGGIPEREMQKLEDASRESGKGAAFKFAFFMDRDKESRKRGVTINYAVQEFFTDKYHYTIVDAPGHRDFIKNMISGASNADVGVLLVPADGGFGVAVQKGDRKKGEIQGQTRQHARLLNLLGIKQLIVCINKMDEGTAGYKQERYEEIRDEMRNMLVSVGWNKDFVAKNVPIIPISGWAGDNIITKSDNMKWWNGMDFTVGSDKVNVHTFLDALNNFVQLPKRNTDSCLRIPVSGIHKIKGVGDVITGRIEQGKLRPKDVVRFIPSYHINGASGTVFSIEMHHRSVEVAMAGDNVGINVKGLTKEKMPKIGDVIVLENDTTLLSVKKFTAQVQVIDHPGELKVGYTPIGTVRTGRAPCKLTAINWKIGKDTNKAKQENPTCLKINDMAEVVFEPTMPFAVEKFTDCEGLGRIAIMDCNSVTMLGKIMATE